MQIIFVSYLNQVVQLQIELGEHVSSYVTADIPSPLLPCSLVRFFFCWNCHFRLIFGSTI